MFQDPKGLEMKGEHESGIAELVEETRSWELVVVGGGYLTEAAEQRGVGVFRRRRQKQAGSRQAGCG